jgi:hypothetical protein
MVILSAAALATAGCGGSDAPSLSDFKSGFQADRAQFHRLGIDLEKTIADARTKTNVQLAAELSTLSGRAAAQAAQLDKLHPPAGYQPSVSKLAAGFRAMATDLRRISDAATRGDARTARAATRSLIADAQTVKAADLAVSRVWRQH